MTAAEALRESQLREKEWWVKAVLKTEMKKEKKCECGNRIIGSSRTIHNGSILATCYLCANCGRRSTVTEANPRYLPPPTRSVGE